MINKMPLFLAKKLYHSENSHEIGNSYERSIRAIKRNMKMADKILWSTFSEETRNHLISDLISMGYVLTENSPTFLRDNYDIAINSLKIEPHSARYIGNISLSTIIKDPELFKKLALNGYKISVLDYYYSPLKNHLDLKVMKKAFEQLVFPSEEACPKKDKIKYEERICELFNKALNTKPTIENFKELFRYYAEKTWENHRIVNPESYINLFNRICIELQNCHDFSLLESKIHDNCMEIEDILGDKYKVLIQAMKEYYIIINSDNDLVKLAEVKDTISSLLALYASKAKDDYINTSIETYYRQLRVSSNFQIGPNFIPRKDHPLIRKYVIERRQKAKFEELYLKHKMDAFINDILNNYYDKTTRALVRKMINKFVVDRISKLEGIIEPPKVYKQYKRYKEALQLIKRLRLGNIKYTDLEVKNYLDIIVFDEKLGEYKYSGLEFTKKDINEYSRYQRLKDIFEKVKRDITFKTRTLKVEEEIGEGYLYAISSAFPFTDEYFEFNPNFLENGLNFIVETFFTKLPKMQTFLDDEVYKFLTDFLVKNNLLWAFMFSYDNSLALYSNSQEFRKKLLGIIDVIPKIIKISKELNYNLRSFKDVELISSLCECADKDIFNVLGEDMVLNLAKDQSMLLYDKEKHGKAIGRCKEIALMMAKRKLSTVPYVEGRTPIYKYSMFTDESVLMSSRAVNSCLKACGNDNDFFHYVLLDKNGFILKIEDYYGNFIGRAAGFRNGNAIFINELRTVYDYDLACQSNSSDEVNAIIDVFRKACEDMINISKNNPEEETKIEFVFVLRAYITKFLTSNVSKDILDYINFCPMENKSEDWEDFVTNTPNLEQCHKIGDWFDTDYSKGKQLICVASSKPIEKVKLRDLKLGDVPALYKKPRSRILVTPFNKMSLNKIKKINITNSYHYNRCFQDELSEDSIEIPRDSIIFTGDNWYLVYSEGRIVTGLACFFDEDAKKEYEIASQIVSEIGLKKINISEVSEKINHLKI